MDALLQASFVERFSLRVLISILYFTNVESAPEPYCLTTFNHSDCGMPRTPVFHYYKSGSRCEIVYWYGCPTANMFANEYQCAHHCIMRLQEYSEPQKTNQTQDKKFTDELNELKPEELKEVEQVLKDVLEETKESHKRLIQMVGPEEVAAEEHVHTEEEESEEHHEPKVPSSDEIRKEAIDFV